MRKKEETKKIIIVKKRYVERSKVEQRESEGWKVIGKQTGIFGELVLMEKKGN